MKITITSLSIVRTALAAIILLGLATGILTIADSNATIPLLVMSFLSAAISLGIFVWSFMVKMYPNIPLSFLEAVSKEISSWTISKYEHNEIDVELSTTIYAPSKGFYRLMGNLSQSAFSKKMEEDKKKYKSILEELGTVSNKFRCALNIENKPFEEEEMQQQFRNFLQTISLIHSNTNEIPKKKYDAIKSLIELLYEDFIKYVPKDLRKSKIISSPHASLRIETPPASPSVRVSGTIYDNLPLDKLNGKTDSQSEKEIDGKHRPDIKDSGVYEKLP